MLIVIEGTDAAGKHTQTGLLVDSLKKEYGEDNVREISFPRYDTILGKSILKELKDGLDSLEDCYKLQSMMIVDRIDASRNFYDTRFLVLDRYYQSGLIYGGVDGIDPEWSDRVTSVLPRAEINILLDVDPDEAAKRRPVFRDKYEKNRDKQRLIADEYRRYWKQKEEALERVHGHTKTVWTTIDGNLAQEVVSTSIWNVVNIYINKYGY